MARAIAGIELPLRVGNGFSKLKVGVDGQSSVQPRSGMGCLKLVLSNEGMGVRRSLQGNKSHFHFGCVKRLDAAWSSISSSPSSVSSETPAGSEESGTVEVSTPPDLRLSDGPSLEDRVEMVIFNCRFLTLMAVVGSLAGSLVCFLKGGVYVIESFKVWFSSFLQHHGTGKVILLLVEALDVYLMGTVMLIFGMGVYGLFISNIEVPSENSTGQVSETVYGSSLFGLFRLQERPNWINIKSLEELKAKLDKYKIP
uniref:TSA: Wollemia nobilis Ref_Wollemi_Transcript_10983_872 transcribed RNA sequence n=1 Tax=Wollemia nobilis TaxID=56998 RepID=A0A0C9S8K0_9CONI